MNTTDDARAPHETAQVFIPCACCGPAGGDDRHCQACRTNPNNYTPAPPLAAGVGGESPATMRAPLTEIWQSRHPMPLQRWEEITAWLENNHPHTRPNPELEAEWFRLADVASELVDARAHVAALTARLTTEAAAAQEDREPSKPAKYAARGLHNELIELGLPNDGPANHNARTRILALVSAFERAAETAEREKLRLHKELRGLRGVLQVAEYALGNCYDVTEWPANGESIQDNALRLVIDAQAPKNDDSPAPPLHRGTEEGEGVGRG